MSRHPKTLLSEAEYLAQERKAESKNEYYQGEVFAMSGASRRRNVIAGNLYAALHQQLRKRKCEVCPGDMRVRVSSTGLYTYPDVTVVCDDPRFFDNEFDTLLNPTFLGEILSPSTEAYDRGRKSEHYRKIDSLAEYLLVARDRIHVDHYTRQPDGIWMLKEAGRPEDRVEFRSIECTLSLVELYEKASF